MFSKSLIVSVFLLILTSSVDVQAAPAPALGIRCNLVRNDVQHPSNHNPCGDVSITNNIGTSTRAAADPNVTPSPLNVQIAAKNAGALSKSTEKLKRQEGAVIDGIVDAAKLVKGVAQAAEAADKFEASKSGSGSNSKRDCKSCFVLSPVFY
jgi:hypothetical protein